MNADDFRDYMLAFLFLRYLSDNYEEAAKKELGRDYPDPGGRQRRAHAAVGVVRRERGMTSRPSKSRCAARRTMSSSRAPLDAHRPPRPHAERRPAQHPAGRLQVHRERVVPEHLRGAVLGDQPRLREARQDLRRAQRQALHDHDPDRRGAGRVLDRRRHARRRVRVPARSVRRRVGQEGGRVLHARSRSVRHPLGIVTLDSQVPETGPRKKLEASTTSPAAPARCC